MLGACTFFKELSQGEDDVLEVDDCGWTLQKKPDDSREWKGTNLNPFLDRCSKSLRRRTAYVYLHVSCFNQKIQSRTSGDKPRIHLRFQQGF